MNNFRTKHVGGYFWDLLRNFENTFAEQGLKILERHANRLKPGVPTDAQFIKTNTIRKMMPKSGTDKHDT